MEQDKDQEALVLHLNTSDEEQKNAEEYDQNVTENGHKLNKRKRKNSIEC